MTKPFLSLPMALSVGVASFQAVSAPVQAAESSAQRAGRAAIVAAQKKVDQATLKKDLPVIMSYLAPDFQMHLSTGQVYNRAQAEVLMRQTWSGSALGVPLNFTKCSSRIKSLTWRGKDAIVMVEATAVGIAKKGALSARVEQFNLTRDYWTPTARGWKVRQSAELEGKIWVNGKRIR